MLDDGRVKSIGQIARKEGVDDRYVARFLNLTTLAPEIVAAILDETLPEDVTLANLSLNPAVVWEGQRKAMGVAGSRRQLAWPVGDNYLGRLDLHRDGPEAGVTVNS